MGKNSFGVVLALVLAAQPARPAGEARALAGRPEPSSMPVPAPALELARQGTTFEEGRAAAVATLVTDLAELADWCNGQSLFLERNTIYELLLEFDPDHDRARKMLKYRRNRDGQWERSDTYREPTNRGEDGLDEVAARRAAIGRRFSDTLHGLLSRYRDDVDRSDRQRVERDVLRVDSADPVTRASRGEVPAGDAWLLAETVRGQTRRVELRRFVAEALANAPEPQDSPVGPAEAELGVEWAHVVDTEAVRVLGTGERAEVVRVARINHAVGDVFRAALDSSTKHYAGYTIYLLGDEAEKRAFLERHPAVTPENRDYLMSLVGTGIPGTANVVQWQADPLARVDGIVRHTFGGFLRDSYGISVEHGWVWEGVGIYLTWRVLGTRLTWYVQPEDYELDGGVSLRPLLHVPGANWTDEAYKMLRSKKRPDLRDVLGRTVSELRVQDMLYAYAVAAYLLEGRPGEAPGLLRRIGEGQEPEVAFEEALGIDLDELPDRIVRWLSERR